MSLTFHWFLPTNGDSRNVVGGGHSANATNSGYPHLEEAYWFGERVLPRLAAGGLWRHPDAPVMAHRGLEVAAS